MEFFEAIKKENYPGISYSPRNGLKTGFYFDCRGFYLFELVCFYLLKLYPLFVVVFLIP